uniref:S1 motif domain-containing protein n=1 Tax=Tetraselmis sp. GSL018 TaxID=582737 RepID=A0A061QV46_9CHLO|eukprot:CAMPEP_0177611132 /NCGR_PEP_ID=MMETSP0419_2-20121207/20289_1 /TAXON_ID=582737 /ORGANISM="Tetraselmis sp., Strain GSL018" /LENGTH=180 /DNA_ID=CAMNT_0019106763 /DNA_START=67 /DNA_END=609 /DNA_ORIENTATION=+
MISSVPLTNLFVSRPAAVRSLRKVGTVKQTSALPLFQQVTKTWYLSSRRDVRFFSAADGGATGSRPYDNEVDEPWSDNSSGKIPIEQLEVGKIYKGVVRSLAPFGAFIDIGSEKDGLAHISQLSDDYVRNVNDVLSMGQEVDVMLRKVDVGTQRMELSIKDAIPGGLKVPPYEDRRSSRY